MGYRAGITQAAAGRCRRRRSREAHDGPHAPGRARNLKSRIVLVSTLDRLSAEELSDTLAFRWNVASGGGQLPFSQEALQVLFEYSEGVPREATILADNALL